MRKLFAILILAALGGGIYLRRDQLKKLLPGHHNDVQAVALEGAPDITKAVQTAAAAAHAEGRTLLYHFSLQECAPCKQLDQNVLANPDWKDFVGKKMKVIDVLFPATFTSENKELAQAIQTREAIEKATGADKGFPMLAVVASDGRILGALTGYNVDGISFYLPWLQKLAAQDTNGAPVKAVAPPPVAAAATNDSTNTPAPKPAATNASTSGKIAGILSGATKSGSAGSATAFRVKGIVGGARPTATVHSGVRAYTVMVGDSINMETANGAVRVKCESITADTVVLLIGEDQTRVEIHL